MKKFTLPTLAAFLFLLMSCDVRKKDPRSISGDRNSMSKKNEKNNYPPTTVGIIDSVYDFGKVKEGDIVEYNYRFKNTGSNPLVIIDARASCGCTVPEKPEAPIKPGEIGFIKVKFNSDNKPGEAHKTITIESNANPEFPLLILKGEVIGKENN